MATVTVYHNPHRSKSRQTPAPLEQRGIRPNVIPRSRWISRGGFDTPVTARYALAALNGGVVSCRS